MKRTIKISLAILTAFAFVLTLIGSGNAAPVFSAKDGAPSLMQFTSGGHVLGFSPSGIFAATPSHSLHVEFENSNRVQPQSDSSFTAKAQAAPLGRITYENLWQGVTLAYTSGSGIYTTTYTLAPGAEVKNIKLLYNAPVALNANGALTIAFENGSLTESAPIAWQNINGKRVSVDAAFQTRGREVSFALGAYDARYPLTIDPTLTWNTFLGGNGTDVGHSIAVDGSGNIFVAGYSSSSWGSPIRPYTPNPYFPDVSDAFVAKLNTSGNLIWNTFLGGTGIEYGGTGYGHAITVDGSGNVFVVGDSGATWGNPVRPFTTNSVGSDGFVAKLDSSGNLVWNTFLGGDSNRDASYSVVADGNGNLFVSGESDSTWGNPKHPFTGYPYNGYTDNFVAKLDSSGALVWNTFVGGYGKDYNSQIVVSTDGNMFLVGGSDASWGNPVNPIDGNADAFVAKLNSSGALQWNTFLGGGLNDNGKSIAVDANDNIFVAGESGGPWGDPLHPFTNPGYPDFKSDAYIAKLSPSGVLQWNTFLGGADMDYGNSLILGRSGNLYISGISWATWGNPLNPFTAYDAFLAKFDSSGALQWNTFLGGDGWDVGRALASDADENIFVAGLSDMSWGHPLHPYAGGNDDAFVVKFATYTYGPNLIKNPGFNNHVANIPAAWRTANFGPTDGVTTLVKKEGAASLTILGKAGVSKMFTQVLALDSGLAGDKFKFSFWSKGQAIPAGGICQAQVSLYNGTALIFIKAISCPLGTYEFTQKTLSFTAPSAYTRAVIRVFFKSDGGAIWFDAMSLAKQMAGQ